MTQSRLTARRALPLLGVAAALLLLVFGLQWAMVRTRTGQAIDGVSMGGKYVQQPWLWDAVPPLLQLAAGGGVLVVSIVGVLALLGSRRYVPVLAGLVLVFGANLTTQVLKKVVFARPHLLHAQWLGWVSGGPANSLPSGHTTVAASIAVALVLVVPAARRRVVAVLGVLYAVAMGVGTVVAAWHRPSDVLAAYLVVAAWMCAVVAGLRMRETARSARHDGVPAFIVGLGVAVLGLLVVGVVVSDPSTARGPGHSAVAFAGAMVLLAGVCGALLAATVALPREPESRAERPSKSDAHPAGTLTR